jgi:hypothetical protein
MNRVSDGLVSRVYHPLGSWKVLRLDTIGAVRGAGCARDRFVAFGRVRVHRADRDREAARGAFVFVKEMYHGEASRTSCSCFSCQASHVSPSTHGALPQCLPAHGLRSCESHPQRSQGPPLG